MIFSRVAACIDGLWGNGLSGGMNMLSKIKKSWTTRKNIRGRSGSMLLLVLIIMAVAVILFASALMIADATRLRYYKSAEQEQASLTAMSAAKLIGTAAKNGGIEDVDLKYMALNGLEVQVSSTELKIPGLSVGDPNSKTSAKFEYYPDVDTGPNIKITVTTVLNAAIVLNAETSSAASSGVATVLLEKVPISSKPFTNLITMGIDDLNHLTENGIDELSISTTNDTDFIDPFSYVVVHGNVTFHKYFSETTPQVNSNIVFTGAVQVTGFNYQIFNRNVALYGNNATIMKGLSQPQINIGGNLFFFRDTPGAVFTDFLGCSTTLGPPIKVTSTDKGVYLLNSDLNATNVTFKTGTPLTNTGIVSGPGSSVNNATGKVASDPFKTSLTTEANLLHDKLSIAVSRKVLTTEDATPLFSPYITGSSVRADTNIKQIYLDGASQQSFTPGSYYIVLKQLGISTLSRILTFDLAQGDCTLYIIDDTPNSGRGLLVTGSIIFKNGDSESVGKILLLDGADMTLGSRYIHGFIIGSITGIKDSGSGTPLLFIFGLGDKAGNPNEIFLANGDIEAFIGLYGTKGKLSFITPYTVDLRVRYEGAIFDAAGEHPQNFPYCPPPAVGALSGTYQPAGYIVGPAT